MKQFHLALCILLVFLFSSCAPEAVSTVPAPTQIPATPTVIAVMPTEAFRSMNMIKIDEPSLMNNKFGETS